MEVHKGEVAKNIVHKCGMAITTISAGLGISRNTLYNKFEDPHLSDAFLLRLGDVIRYDFSINFPSLKQEKKEEIDDRDITYVERAVENLLRIDRKYIELLERYNGLLSMLVKLTKKDEDNDIKKKICDFFNNPKRT
jgi:hypothetical protein